MKFKVGDRVRVKRNNKFRDGEYAGKIGLVVRIRYGHYPYLVGLDEFNPYYSFHANELERLEEAK